jgi:putative oxygen-independent coproporphyrinogen III oxidase
VISSDTPGSPTSVYVHFPWCLKKCPYCDFATRKIDRAAVPHREYASAVIAELDRRRTALEGRRLTSVFFGGGTPSLWEAGELGRVLDAIRAAFEREAEELEITVECNPTSLDRERAAALARAGVNRLSIGVQSLSDSHLRFLGRLHDSELAVRAVRDAIAEVPRVSADLMFGMPDQDPNELLAAIEALLDAGVRHVSSYALTIEPGTQFGELHRAKKLQVASEDTVADMFGAAHALFERRGLAHYEVSNFAMPSEEARHNLHYWRGLPYLGLGAAAVGCLDAGEGRAVRYRNEPDGERYMSGAGAEEEALGAIDLVREAWMLGLRTREGVDAAAVQARLGVDPREGREREIARRVERGDLVREGSRFYVPNDRWIVLDSIVRDLF